MAEPISTTLLVAKAAANVLSDERFRKGIGLTVGLIFSPIILILVLICGLLSGTADHNNTAISLCFEGGEISENIPEDYRGYIEDMGGSFTLLEGAAASVNSEMEDGDSLDLLRVKAIFYALFFGEKSPSKLEHRGFVDSFVTYEKRTRTVTKTDAVGNETTVEEIYRVAVPITDLTIVYENLENMMEIRVSSENQMNANRIYSLVKYGHGAIDKEEILYPGEPIGDGSYQALIGEAQKYIGFPYVWGGSNPSTSFDCSGYICWVYTKSGVYNLPRTTATGIYNQCTFVQKDQVMPGDLVFFQGTYAGAGVASHVGSYVGNGKMLHAGNPIGYDDIHTKYWKKHFLAFGRLHQ